MSSRSDIWPLSEYAARRSADFTAVIEWNGSEAAIPVPSRVSELLKLGPDKVVRVVLEVT